jgi:8-oxo-dGTP diphosphatase
MRVVAAVIEDKGEFLACRRAANKSMAGKWEFPGGKVEPGETDKEALEREIKEELNVQISVGKLIAVSINDLGTEVIEMYSYLAELDGDRPFASSDHDELVWLSRNETAALDWAELDVPVVKALEAHTH